MAVGGTDVPPGAPDCWDSRESTERRANRPSTCGMPLLSLVQAETESAEEWGPWRD